jgi:ABC-type sugar transport system ATPase subunit
VTHDQQEALILAHIMAIMNVGSIEQVGKPQEIYNAPDSKHIAEFLNYHSDTPAINFFDGELFENALKESLIGVRSEDIKLCEHGAERSFPGVVIDVRHDPITSVTILNMTIYNTKCYARMPLNTNINTQAEVAVRFKKYHVFDKHTGLRTQTVQSD